VLCKHNSLLYTCAIRSAVGGETETSSNAGSRLPRIDDAGATFALELPDFSGGLIKGFWKLLRIFTLPGIQKQFETLLSRASFLYVEAPSFESYLVARLSKKKRIPFVMEMRGDVQFNYDYMTGRFVYLAMCVACRKKIVCHCAKSSIRWSVY